MAFTAGTMVKIRPARSRYGAVGETPVYQGLVNTSQTIVAGDVLIVSTNKLSKGADGPDLVTVVGIAASPITTGGSVDDRTNVVDYYPALAGMVFQGNISSDATSGTDTAAATTHLLADEALGLVGSDWFVDVTEATNVGIRTINYLPVQNNKGATTLGDFVFGQTAVGQLRDGIGGANRVGVAAPFAWNDQIIDAGTINPQIEFVFTKSYWHSVA